MIDCLYLCRCNQRDLKDTASVICNRDDYRFFFWLWRVNVALTKKMLWCHSIGTIKTFFVHCPVMGLSEDVVKPFCVVSNTRLYHCVNYFSFWQYLKYFVLIINYNLLTSIWYVCLNWALLFRNDEDKWLTSWRIFINPNVNGISSSRQRAPIGITDAPISVMEATEFVWPARFSKSFAAAWDNEKCRDYRFMRTVRPCRNCLAVWLYSTIVPLSSVTSQLVAVIQL